MFNIIAFEIIHSIIIIVIVIVIISLRQHGYCSTSLFIVWLEERFFKQPIPNNGE